MRCREVNGESDWETPALRNVPGWTDAAVLQERSRAEKQQLSSALTDFFSYNITKESPEAHSGLAITRDYGSRCTRVTRNAQDRKLALKMYTHVPHGLWLSSMSQANVFRDTDKSQSSRDDA